MAAAGNTGVVNPIVQSVSAVDAAATGSATITITGVTSGNSLVLIWSQAPHSSSITPVLTVTDSNGVSAFTEGVVSTGPDDTNFNNSIAVHYKLNAEAGSHTLTLDNIADVGSPDGFNAHLIEIVTATSFDSGAATNKVLSATSHTSSTYTPSTTVLAIAAITVTDNTTAAGITDPPSGWTSQYVHQNGVTAPFVPMQVSIKKNASGAQSATWTNTNTYTSWSLVCGFILA